MTQPARRTRKSTTTPKETTVTSAVAEKPAVSTKSAEVPAKRDYHAVDLDVSIVEVKPATGNPFARGATKALDDNHPLVKAWNMSLEHETALDVTTPDPRSVVAILRRIANQRSQGLRIDVDTRMFLKGKGDKPEKVTFQAKATKGRQTADDE